LHLVFIFSAFSVANPVTILQLHAGHNRRVREMMKGIGETDIKIGIFSDKERERAP